MKRANRQNSEKIYCSSAYNELFYDKEAVIYIPELVLRRRYDLFSLPLSEAESEATRRNTVAGLRELLQLQNEMTEEFKKIICLSNEVASQYASMRFFTSNTPIKAHLGELLWHSSQLSLICNSFKELLKGAAAVCSIGESCGIEHTVSEVMIILSNVRQAVIKESSIHAHLDEREYSHALKAALASLHAKHTLIMEELRKGLVELERSCSVVEAHQEESVVLLYSQISEALTEQAATIKILCNDKGFEQFGATLKRHQRVAGLAVSASLDAVAVMRAYGTLEALADSRGASRCERALETFEDLLRYIQFFEFQKLPYKFKVHYFLLLLDAGLPKMYDRPSIISSLALSFGRLTMKKMFDEHYVYSWHSVSKEIFEGRIYNNSTLQRLYNDLPKMNCFADYPIGNTLLTLTFYLFGTHFKGYFEAYASQRKLQLWTVELVFSLDVANRYRQLKNYLCDLPPSELAEKKLMKIEWKSPEAILRDIQSDSSIVLAAISQHRARMPGIRSVTVDMNGVLARWSQIWLREQIEDAELFPRVRNQRHIHISRIIYDKESIGQVSPEKIGHLMDDFSHYFDAVISNEGEDSKKSFSELIDVMPSDAYRETFSRREPIYSCNSNGYFKLSGFSLNTQIDLGDRCILLNLNLSEPSDPIEYKAVFATKLPLLSEGEGYAIYKKMDQVERNLNISLSGSLLVEFHHAIDLKKVVFNTPSKENFRYWAIPIASIFSDLKRYLREDCASQGEYNFFSEEERLAIARVILEDDKVECEVAVRLSVMADDALECVRMGMAAIELKKRELLRVSSKEMEKTRDSFENELIS